MHDLRLIRADPAAFDRALARRGLPPAAEEIIAEDAERRAALTALQDAQTRRNVLAKQIGQGRRTGVDTTALEAEATALRDQMDALEQRAAALETATDDALAALPNVLADEVPDGRDESANKEEFKSGEPPSFDFKPREHFELGEALHLPREPSELGEAQRLMDFAAAAKLAGSRFTVLRGLLARLERALGQFMIDLHTQEHGYTEISVPLLVNSTAVYRTNQLPKFADDLFQTTDGRWLIPTAEVPLTNLFAGSVVHPSYLPKQVTALSECFRAEAGAAGRDTRGMLRQHQFRKVELVSISLPEKSEEEHQNMTRCAEVVLERLELVYRRMLLCAGDTGFGAKKTYDLEVWLPGQQAWREISSCSNMGDFQARRMNARYFVARSREPNFVHTLNGSGVAVGRALIAVMETHQRADGGINIPEALRPYMGGLTCIPGPG